MSNGELLNPFRKPLTTFGGTAEEQVKSLQDQMAQFVDNLSYSMELVSARDAWQVSEEDNVSSTNGLLVDIYIPPDRKTRHIERVLIRVRLKAFRSYSSTTSSGGGTVSTTSTSILVYDVDTRTTDPGGTDSHTHTYQDFKITGSAEHEHSVSIPSHSHGINPGIFTSTTASGCTIWVNGSDRTNALTGGATFSADQDELDVTEYMTATGYNTVEVRSGTIGRVRCTAFVNLYLNS
jgi:hypothetical protein